jgi:hypothetical protein
MAENESGDKTSEKFRSKAWRNIGYFGGIIAIISLILTSAQLYNDYFVPARADLKIIVDPYEAVWESSLEKDTS